MTIQEKIAAAKERAKKAQEAVAALEAKAAEPPKRQTNRSPTQIKEILALETQLKKAYGCGFAGLANVVSKARKDGVSADSNSSVIIDGDHENDPLPPAPPEPADPAAPGVVYDAADEPPVPNPPEAVTAPADDMPW